MHLLNQTEEAILRVLLECYEMSNKESYVVSYDWDKSPEWISWEQWSKTKEKLENDGIYLQPSPKNMDSGSADRAILTPSAITYFEDKRRYLEEQENAGTSATYIFTATNQQVSIAKDNSVIHATQNIGINASQLVALIEAVRANIPADISGEDLELVNDSLTVIETLKDDRPKMGLIRAAFATLKGLKYSAKLTEAIATLYKFVQSTLQSVQ